MDNRKFPRVPVSFYLWYRLEGTRDSDVKIGAEGRQATMVNISEGGVALLTDSLIPEETKLDLKFHLTFPEKELPPVLAVGQVCYNFLIMDQKLYHTGVEFIMIKNKDRKIIADFVRSRTKL